MNSCLYIVYIGSNYSEDLPGNIQVDEVRIKINEFGCVDILTTIQIQKSFKNTRSEMNTVK